MKTETVRTRPRQARQASRRAQVVVRRVGPWSVLKFSLLFYFLLMLVFLFAMVIVYWILGVVGVIDSISHLLSTAGFGSPRTGFKIHGGWIFTRVFLIGVVGVFVWSFVNALVAVLYNLVSDVVGGVQVTLSERPR